MNPLKASIFDVKFHGPDRVEQLPLSWSLDLLILMWSSITGAGGGGSFVFCERTLERERFAIVDWSGPPHECNEPDGGHREASRERETDPAPGAIG